MVNLKLEKIGEKLNVSDDDLKNIEKERRRIKFLYPIGSAITVICSAILGYLLGISNEKLVNSETGGVGYPSTMDQLCYTSMFGIGSIVAAVALLVLSNKRSPKYKRLKIITVIVTVVVSIIVFASVYTMSQPVVYYEGAILYNVFQKKTR